MVGGREKILISTEVKVQNQDESRVEFDNNESVNFKLDKIIQDIIHMFSLLLCWSDIYRIALLDYKFCSSCMEKT